jgi:cell division transport system ATP-binding protein
MIRFNNVSKRYENGHQGLENINFHLPKGEMAFLTGHSGAGKSTLLKLIMMIEPVTRGQILIDSKNLSRLSSWHVPYLRRSIGMIFQNPTLINDRTVFDNMALPLIIAGCPKQEMAKRVRAALDKVGLLNKEKYFPLELSVGEQQRVGIARAIVNRPPLLLADEPTGNLDPELAADIMHLFEEFNRVGVTVLVATHDLNLVASMQHRIFVLKQGQLISGGCNDN